MGIAAAGFALGAPDGDAFLIKPGKRKTPGGDTVRSPELHNKPFPARRTVSQPVARSVTLEPKDTAQASHHPTSAPGLFRQRTIRNTESASNTDSNGKQSRASSSSRHNILSSWSTDRESSSERKDSRPSSSWLKRLSTVSSFLDSSPDDSATRVHSHTGILDNPSARDRELPNKLVKRASSFRVFSSESRKDIFRRPATSHLRSQTLLTTPYQKTALHDGSADRDESILVNSPTLWRPYFDSGYARKRHTSGVSRETARTVSGSPGIQPTLIMGSNIQQRYGLQDNDDNYNQSSPSMPPQSSRRQKLRRSLGSVRRAGRLRTVTDPQIRYLSGGVFDNVQPLDKRPTLSPMSDISAFEVDLPQTTPVFHSSPPMFSPPQSRFTISKRISVAPSDPTTVSSDNETRIFTDDDSMDFQSDTAFDSLATRATASSHSGLRQPKIETIFDDLPLEADNDTRTIEDLLQGSTLDDLDSNAEISSRNETRNNGLGVGIFGLNIEHDSKSNASQDVATTPVRLTRLNMDEFMATPTARKEPRPSVELPSSPPSILLDDLAARLQQKRVYLDDMEEDIDWSPTTDRDIGDKLLDTIPSSPVRLHFENDIQEPNSSKRSSIFDWSEYQKFGSEPTNGISPRPKTVHGKQSNDSSRSRAPGRKGPSTMHLRSQSVPVSREGPGDPDLPSNSKFGTWGLGHKPVSEEWSDDFEFDDMDGLEEVDEKDESNSISTTRPSQRDSIRSVKVPQSIIDRQASVHLQFGQVQEFMLLVEELRRLRVQGGTLGLLDSHSKQLWDDADSIINLATLNDEDEEHTPQRPPSPTSSDAFGDEASPNNKSPHDNVIKFETVKRNSLSRRSLSSPSTPPIVRPRGEGLAQAKSFLETIHQIRSGTNSSPGYSIGRRREKLPFDTQDLRDLVIRAGVITRALKEIVRKAEGVSVSPNKTPQKHHDPSFRQIFTPPDLPPSPTFNKGSLPQSRSANSFLRKDASIVHENEMSTPLKLAAILGSD